MYQERMLGYYPKVIQNVLEFRGLIDSEYPEIEDLESIREQVLDDAYLLTMNEDRIKDWERILNLKPVEGSTLEDRRDSVIATIRGQGKLNSKLIDVIVSSFTGGIAESWIIDSVLYVKVYPPSNSKPYIFDNVRNVLMSKIPAHLGLNIYRNYATWGGIKSYSQTWENVNNTFPSWEHVKFFMATDTKNVFEYLVDESGNSITNELDEKLFN